MYLYIDPYESNIVYTYTYTGLAERLVLNKVITFYMIIITNKHPHVCY